MKTKKTLSELFEQARIEAPEAPVSKILSLVENGKTSPLAVKHSLRPRRIKQMFNPLKILIMITPIVIITAAFLLFHATTDKVQVGERLNTENGQVSNSNNKGEKVNNDPDKVIELKQQSPKKPVPTGKSRCFEVYGF